MSFGSIVKKLITPHQPTQEEREHRKGMTPNEVELAWFEERERRKRIKDRLEKFRKQESTTLWKGSNILDSKNILDQKNRF